MDKCVSCCLDKLHKLPTPSKSSPSSTSIIELIFMDIWGLSSVVSLDGARYYINFVDATRNTIGYIPLPRNQMLFRRFITFRNWIEKQLGKQIKVV